jgi:DNA-binding FrmR family transcriptional regulator
MKKQELTKEERQKSSLNRIARIIGHTISVKHMIEDGRDCSEVLIQLSAVNSALNNLGKELLKGELNEIAQESARTGDQDSLKEMNRLIDTFIK